MAEGTTAMGRTRMHDIDLLSANGDDDRQRWRGGEPVQVQGSYCAMRRKERKPSADNDFGRDSRASWRGRRPMTETGPRENEDRMSG
jgi:hypothetical protein